MGYINSRRRKRLFKALRKASSEDLGEIIQYILRRYSAQYPDDDFIFLTLPKNDPVERNRTLDALRTISQNRTSSF